MKCIWMTGYRRREESNAKSLPPSKAQVSAVAVDSRSTGGNAASSHQIVIQTLDKPMVAWNWNKLASGESASPLIRKAVDASVTSLYDLKPPKSGA